MTQINNQINAWDMLNILSKSEKPLTNYDIDKKAIKYNKIGLINVKWYAQRDLEYMGLMERTKARRSKMQEYFLTEKWKSLETIDDMIDLRWMVSQKKHSRRSTTIRSSREESEIKKLNKELNTTLLECPPPPVRSSLLWRIKHFIKNLIDNK